MSSVSELADLMERHTGTDGVHTTDIPRVALYRLPQSATPLYAIYEPAVCIVGQGRKQVIAGEHVYTYDAENYLVVSADVPVIGQVLDAPSDRPFLAALLRLDTETLNEVLLDSGLESSSTDVPVSALAVAALDPELRDAFVRLLRLLDTPQDVQGLAPLVEREILYRLLRGPQATAISQLVRTETRLGDIQRAIIWIRQNLPAPLHVGALASLAGMSPSSLHHHFKAVTGFTPLQYQKRLRLQEARRLLISESVNASSAAHLVGYESPSQFSREYRRLFGAPPLRDIEQLRVEGDARASTAMPKSGIESAEA